MGEGIWKGVNIEVEVMELMSILIYAIPGLAFLIVIHELGHLLVARWCGIGVEAFSLFFGRAIYKFHWKGIEWRMGWIPFGGYCKMKGQEDFGKMDVKGEEDEFYERPGWARLGAVFAGPLFNIVLGFLLFIGLTYFQKEKLIPSWPVKVEEEYRGELSLKDGDVIRGVDGHRVEWWNEVQEYLAKGIYKEEQVLLVDRGGEEVEVEYRFDKEKRIKNELGFGLPQLVMVVGVEKEIIVGEGMDGEAIWQAGPAFGSELESGDIIIGVGGEGVFSPSGLVYLLNRDEGKKRYRLTVLKGVGLGLLKSIRGVKGVKGGGFKDLEDLKVLMGGSREEYWVEVLTEGGLEEKVVRRKEVEVEVVEVKEYNPALGRVEIKKKLGIGLSGQLFPGIMDRGVDKEYTFLESLDRGIEKSWNLTTLAITQFKLLTQLKAETARENVAGPVGIIKYLGTTGSKSFTEYIKLLAMLSLFLGIFNLLPIPAVDGGHIVLTLFEMIRGKRLSMKVIERFQMVGILIVVSIAVLVTINDFYKLFMN